MPRRSYVSSVLSYFSSLLILIMDSESTLAGRLAQFDEEHEFLRRNYCPRRRPIPLHVRCMVRGIPVVSEPECRVP